LVVWVFVLSLVTITKEKREKTMSQHKEDVFESEVVNLLKGNGYNKGTSNLYDKELALYPILEFKKRALVHFAVSGDIMPLFLRSQFH